MMIDSIRQIKLAEKHRKMKSRFGKGMQTNYYIYV